MRALLWDVDGTLAETERDGHRVAFNAAFEACGLGWRWDETRYGELLAVTGGRERLLHDMASRSDAPPAAAEREALARRLHEHKNRDYARRVRAGQVPLRPGVREVMEAGPAQGIAMGIVTTSGRGNVEALLEAAWGPGWADRFAVVVCGDDVARKKPDPEAYRLALDRLALRADEVLAIEDSPAGAEAARQAGCPFVITWSSYFAAAEIPGAIAAGPGLHERADWQPPADGEIGPIGLPDLQRWWALGVPVRRQWEPGSAVST
ncbi:MAG TPA: HAD-IA family hydrolase [Methylibium sp.]|nr:HAD-IA family hydrolase [Methylibium sp.]HEU4458917.1 HAD-IA family hydrolase [Methylibium sp.]